MRHSAVRHATPRHAAPHHASRYRLGDCRHHPTLPPRPAFSFWIWHPLYTWMDRRFGFGTRAVVIKVFVDNFIGLPFIDLPSFYLCTLAPRVGLSEAAHRLWVDWWPSMQMGLCVWVSLPRRPPALTDATAAIAPQPTHASSTPLCLATGTGDRNRVLVGGSAAPPTAHVLLARVRLGLLFVVHLEPTGEERENEGEAGAPRAAAKARGGRQVTGGAGPGRFRGHRARCLGGTSGTGARTGPPSARPFGAPPPPPGAARVFASLHAGVARGPSETGRAFGAAAAAWPAAA